ARARERRVALRGRARARSARRDDLARGDPRGASLRCTPPARRHRGPAGRLIVSQSLADVALAHIESGKARIPIFDRGAARAQQMLADGSFEIEELEALIASEPALASALLRAANSSLYGGLDKVVEIREAILRLGARRSAQLVVVM